VSSRDPGTRFWSKVQRGEGCWLWTASLDAYGYGQFGLNGTMMKAHRVAWELTYGPIPEGMQVLHNCQGGDNRACVRHLWLGTNDDNMADMVAKGRARSPRLRGEQHGRAKLTATKVQEIRRRAASEPIRALARIFGVDPRTIGRIVRRHLWTHVPEVQP